MAVQGQLVGGAFNYQAAVLTLTAAVATVQTTLNGLTVHNSYIAHTSRQVDALARGLHNLGKAVKDLAATTGPGNTPTTLTAKVMHVIYSSRDALLGGIFWPATASFKLLVNHEPLGAAQDLAAGFVTYAIILPKLIDPYVPTIGDSLRAARSAAVNAGWWGTKQAARAVAEEGYDTVKEYASDIKGQTKEYLSKQVNDFMASIPMMAPRATSNIPLTTAQRAAKGLGAGETPQAGSYAFQATPPGPGSDLFPLLTLAVGAGALYIASSKLTSYWNSQAENKEESK